MGSGTGTEVTEQDHLHLALNPLTHEPDAGQHPDKQGGDALDDPTNPSGASFSSMPQFEYRGLPRHTDLAVLAELLSTTFALPAKLCAETLQRVQEEQRSPTSMVRGAGGATSKWMPSALRGNDRTAASPERCS